MNETDQKEAAQPSGKKRRKSNQFTNAISKSLHSYALNQNQ